MRRGWLACAAFIFVFEKRLPRITRIKNDSMAFSQEMLPD
jgi:hypothetical protein